MARPTVAITASILAILVEVFGRRPAVPRPEAAALAGVSLRTLERWIKAGGDELAKRQEAGVDCSERHSTPAIVVLYRAAALDRFTLRRIRRTAARGRRGHRR